tara:strand:+ start:24 stop:1274 length:1251 start_codon:yes stop_codon:yes gene_type:complete
MKEKNFFLLGGNFINKGAEAMLKTVQFHILEAHPNAAIYVRCRYAEKDIAIKQGFIPVYENLSGIRKIAYQFYEKALAKTTAALGRKPIPFADRTPIADMRRKIKRVHMGIDVSGYAYGDSRDYMQPLETIKAINFCKERGGKFVFMPQAWGSFELADVAQNVRDMLKLSDDFFVRDTVSRDYIAGLLGKDAASVPVYPDIAFTFPHPGLERGGRILSSIGRTSSQRKLLAICPNMRVYARSEGKGEDNVYVQKLVKIARHAMDKMDMDVVLVPNEVRPVEGYHPDDRFICRLLNKAISDEERCFYVSEYYSAEEVKSVLGHADLVVASRFHSLIFALSQGIPCMAISWSHKYRELFALFGMEKFVVEDSDINNTGLFELLTELNEQNEQWSTTIKETLPKIKEKLSIPLSKIRLG